MEAILKNRLNDVFKNLESMGSAKGVQRVHSEVVKELPKGECEFSQGEGGEKFDIFHIEDLDIHIKVTKSTDSYAENEWVSAIEFVTPKKVEKIVYINKFD